MNIWKLSWKSLMHKPWSMALTLILFALGIGLVSFLFVVEKQIQDKFEKNLAGVDLVVGAKGSPLQLILSSMYHVDAPTGNMSIDEIRPFLNPKHPLIESALPLSMGDSYRGYRVVGTTTDMLDWYEAKVVDGREWKYNFEVVIGHTVAQELGITLGKEFKSSHGFGGGDDHVHDDAESFKVVGVLAPTGSVIDQLILTTPQTFWLVHGHSDDDHDHDGDGKPDHEAHEHDHSHDEDENRTVPLSLTAESGEKEITSLLLRFRGRNFQALNMQRSINENTDLQAATPAIEINRLFSMMDSGERMLRLLAMVIILVSGLSIFISLYNSLSDRKYELALMRSMGAGKRTIFGHIITEGMILAIVGCILGLLISHIGLSRMGSMLEDSYRYQFDAMTFVDREWWLILFALVVGFLAALLPAIKASKTDIADTLVNS